MRVFLVCPANVATGGTELLHQFSKCLSDAGVENYMLYPDANGINCPTPKTFMKYGVRYVTQYIDAEDSVLVLAETQIHLVDSCKKGIAVIWWLSVNNYFHAYEGKISEEQVDIFGLRERQNILHFVQSHYAKDFVNSYFEASNCYFLMDYINDDIVNHAREYKDSYERQNICLYNPKKGYEVLKPIIAACKEEIAWLPLMNMTPEEMADVMCRAKLYVDFGEHPGKDRIPREAAVCGCCILTNQQGSASYDEDVMIPERYKIENPSDIDLVLGKIYDLVENYEDRVQEYSTYRDMILHEKEDFVRDVQNFIVILETMLATSVFEELSVKGKRIAEDERYVQIIDSIQCAAIKVSELAKDAKETCAKGDLSGTMNELLTMDYLLQVIRETVYAELMNITR